MSSRRNPNVILPDLIELTEWYAINIVSLKTYKEQVFEARANTAISITPKFKGLQDEEINETFEVIEDEVKKLFLFSILSITEGNIRKDFYERVKDVANKDMVSKKYQKLYAEKGPQKAKTIWLESFMDIWKNKFADQGIKDKIGNYKTTLRFRHWMAHGRYYPFNFHLNYEPDKIALECVEILKMIPLSKL